ncbi:type II toxin-antitoxin system HipA family toxin [Herbaspirillum sp. RV1423]|uniref:type II toxin-antitoxin system HipA family toxin n=1 Tax=Herbaspirillum sp. RV1423 TaxID=1443993 RepID=UPI0004B28D39|nr:HipA domain-containing protein [Herbaspirillum sp. RV1423]
MSLYLVGQNIDKAKSHYQAEKGQLVQLMRGIYVDAADDANAVVLKHAVRIANYLYPTAYLSAASAVLLGPTRDGRLFLSGRRSQRTRIRSLEIIQNPAPDKPSIGNAVIDDGMGEFHVKVSAMRQRFLEAFRVRSEHAASIDDDMRDAIRTRLIAEFGSPKGAADAVWALARENAWYKEGEQAERFLLHAPSFKTVRNEAAIDLIVAWHGVAIGNLVHDGFEWRWNPAKTKGPALIRQTTPGALPPFIVSLLPEGWLETVLRNEDERTMLRSGKRYMSNITIVEQERELKEIAPDVLVRPLSDFTRDGVFIGRYRGPSRDTLETSFEKNLADLYASADTPRLSGIQIKAPMYLDKDGDLSASTSMPFTHILKPAGKSGFEALPVIEWLSLQLGKAVGFTVPSIAFVEMPDNMPPALLVERFDIRTSAEDQRRLAMEDLCSVLDLPPELKYSGTMERIAHAVRSLSTSPEADLLGILKRALFAWLIADGDMHLKNMALLKIADPGDDFFRSVRVAPLYDAVTTRVFPRLQDDRMALKLNGKNSRLRRADFRALATTVGIRAGDADAAIDQIVDALNTALITASLPKLHYYGDDGQVMAKKMLAVVKGQLDGFS